MKNIVWNLLFGWCFLVLSACGGGGDSGGSGGSGGGGVPAPSIGVFLDSAVENVHYRTATQSGYTNALGQFKYAAGETVTFSIGGIDLPPVTAGSQITPVDLAKTTTNPSNALTNLLVLLQSLDTDSDPTNGIKLNDASKSIPASTLDLTLAPAQFSQMGGVLRSILTTSNMANKVPVTAQDALAHFSVSNPNAKAVAVVSTSGTAVVGNTITLRSTGSFDLNGQPLASYQWTVTSSPAYSNANINNPTSSTASLSLNVAGDYAVTLAVTNTIGLIGTTSMTIKAAPHPKFGSSILTMYATQTGVDLTCNSGEDATTCDRRLKQRIHTENLGCVTCDASQAASICNFTGEFGSLTGSRSIWNTGANQYGNPSNESSPWNTALNAADRGKILRITPLLLTAYTDVVDERAIAFTLNSNNDWLGPYLPEAVNEPLLIDMLSAYSAANASPESKRAAVCNTLSQAMQ